MHPALLIQFFKLVAIKIFVIYIAAAPAQKLTWSINKTLNAQAAHC